MYFGEHGEHSDHGNDFVAFIGTDCNKWLWNHKIIQLTVFLRSGWGFDENLWTLAEEGELPKSNKWEQGGDSKFWSFCDNVTIECQQYRDMLLRII